MTITLLKQYIPVSRDIARQFMNLPVILKRNEVEMKNLRFFGRTTP